VVQHNEIYSRWALWRNAVGADLPSSK
jgi:hypothetical protein